MYLKLFLFFALWIYPSSIHSSASLEVIDDQEFINLSSVDKYIVVLFSKPNCDECDIIEDELVAVREELADTLNAWVVKIHNSNLVQIYSPTKEPALVFFRHGVPLLYNGEISDEQILHTFTENREPVVRELDDNNFEHLTQAATGATTSDWFVMFYSKTCVTSHRLTARWEAVGAALRTRMNVARVDISDTGVLTARRFAVYTTPTFILFHLGNMFRYPLNDHNIDNFVNFATGGYKNIAKSEPVPLPKTPFDDPIQMIVDYLAGNTWIVGAVFIVLLGVAGAISFRSSQAKAKKKKKKSKKNSKDGVESQTFIKQRTKRNSENNWDN